MSEKNPWLDIPAEDYAGHMGSEAVGQLPVLKGLFADALAAFSPQRLLVLGCGTGNGFDFIAPDHREAFQAVERALRTYADPEHWDRLVRNAIRARDRQGRDFSWDAAAERYAAELYE
ncbi:MAG: hypothetical protein HGB17_10920 [Syntrophobacteraceae bacterium]|nr:hypothetical protein [Syntrophobacteraceae bacterium]